MPDTQTEALHVDNVKLYAQIAQLIPILEFEGVFTKRHVDADKNDLRKALMGYWKPSVRSTNLLTWSTQSNLYLKFAMEGTDVSTDGIQTRVYPAITRMIVQENPRRHIDVNCGLIKEKIRNTLKIEVSS